MKRLFVLILLVLIAGYWVADKIAEDAGYILLSYQNTTIETSMWIGLVLLLALVATIYMSVWLLIRVLGSRAMVQRWTYNFRHKRSVSKTTSGLIDLVEGNWKNAQKKLSQAAPRSETPLINYLSAARAAAANGDPNGSELFLKKAHESTPGAELAVGITKAEIEIQQEQYEQALASLLVLRHSHPRHKHLVELLQQVYVGLDDWEGLQELTPMLRKLKVAPDARLDDLEHKTVLKVLDRASTPQAGQDAGDSAIKLDKAWQRVSGNIRQLEDVTRLYVSSMTRFAEHKKAEAALRDTLDCAWSDALAVEYGVLESSDEQQQLRTAERWLKKHKDSAELQLTLGRLSLRNQLWGKAREYFLGSLALRETSQAHAELGRLLKYMGESEAYLTHVQQGFDVVFANLPVMPMPDEQRTSIAQMAVKS
ncbi:MAG: heme biosynthesis HemY N-terminal domain-containing protein [Pseudomonadales bacterium]